MSNFQMDLYLLYIPKRETNKQKKKTIQLFQILLHFCDNISGYSRNCHCREACAYDEKKLHSWEVTTVLKHDRCLERCYHLKDPKTLY